MQLMPLADFIGQLYAGSINPATSYFLPTVILGQTTPLEPLAIGDYQWGSLAGVSATLPAELCRAVSPGGGGPGPPAATLALSQMQIVGLSNVLPAQPVVNGTSVSGRLEFGGAAAKLPAGLTVPPQLLIQGTFIITLTACGPKEQQITGTFAVGFRGASLDFALDVTTTAGDQPQFNVSATRLSFGATEVLFAFKATGMAGGTVNSLLRTAFNANAAGTLLGIVRDRLAAPAGLAALGAELTTAFNSLANPSLLAFAVSMLYNQAAKPGGSYYLPNEIKQATNPVLDPFSADGWNIPDVGQWYQAVGATICASIGAQNNDIDIQVPGTPVPLPLSGIQISGTSNLMALPPLTIGDTITGIVACNAVPGWPVSLRICGNFQLTVTCCVSQDNQVCAGTAEASTGSGTFSATIANATVSTHVTLSVSPDNKLIATADSIYFRCDPDVDNLNNVQIDIKITSIPAGQQSAWNSMAIEVFNSPQAVAAMVDQVRARLNQDVVRDRLSQIATQAIQSIMPSDPHLTSRIVREVRAAGQNRGG